MRIIKLSLYLFLLITFTFQSCSIEKRRYTNGYSLQWKKSNCNTIPDNTNEGLTQTEQQPKKKEVSSDLEEVKILLKNIDALTASIGSKKEIILFTLDSMGCDTIIMRNEIEIKAKVIEITPTEIKYKYCDNVTGPTYVSYRYEVSYIKYANGRLDSFKNEYAPIRSTQNNQANFNNQNEGYDSWALGRTKKMSLLSIIFGFIALVPFYGFPGIFIAMSSGFKALKLIKKNPRELGIYRQKALLGIGLAALAILLYIVFFGYILIKSGMLRFII